MRDGQAVGFRTVDDMKKILVVHSDVSGRRRSPPGIDRFLISGVISTAKSVQSEDEESCEFVTSKARELDRCHGLEIFRRCNCNTSAIHASKL